MIDSLEIKNIQSHADSHLDFSSGINAFVGSTNNGKSAVLRALLWAITNRPLGTDILLSNWAYDKKGKQCDEMSVTVKKDGSTLVRRKTKDTNEYVIDDAVYEALKTEIPDEVRKFFSLSETNIQRQQDAPFLLSLSSGKVAEYFNRIVRLDVIDKILSNAESIRRKTRNSLEQAELTHVKLDKESENYSWLETVDKLLTKYENVDSKNNDIKIDMDYLSELISEYRDIKAKSYPDLDKEKKLVVAIEKSDDKAYMICTIIDSLSSMIDEYKAVKDKLESVNFDKEKKLISKIEEINGNLEKISSEGKDIRKSVDEYKLIKTTVSDNNKRIIELKKELPEICPVCGARMKDGVCIKEK